MPTATTSSNAVKSEPNLLAQVDALYSSSSTGPVTPSKKRPADDGDGDGDGTESTPRKTPAPSRSRGGSQTPSKSKSTARGKRKDDDDFVPDVEAHDEHEFELEDGNGDSDVKPPRTPKKAKMASSSAASTPGRKVGGGGERAVPWTAEEDTAWLGVLIEVAQPWDKIRAALKATGGPERTNSAITQHWKLLKKRVYDAVESTASARLN